MSNAKHTPGPWQVNNNDPLQVCDSDGEKRGCSPIANTRGKRGEAKANARLIAAAPELLAALESLLDYDNLGAYERANVRKQSRAAIAKAKGE